MLTLAEQPDTFYLRIEKQEEQDTLRKKDILVRWSISSDRGFTWEYLQHEYYERSTLLSDWVMTDKYKIKMTRGLEALIESQLEWEVWQEFYDSQKHPDPDNRMKIDRRRLFGLLVTWRMSKMADVKNPQEAVDVLRWRMGGNISELARQALTNRTSLILTDAGVRNLSGSVMKRLARIADRLMEWKCAEKLRSHAMVAGLNVNRRGGHR